jgi:hypothetical protein
VWARICGWIGGSATQAQKPGSGRSNKPLVQSELWLAEVKVVRNDLSDADLEVVRLRPGVRRKGAGAGLAKGSSSDSVWTRATVRLFGPART